MEFLVIEIHDGTVVDHVAECDERGCRGTGRGEMVTEIEGVMVDTIVEPRDGGFDRLRKTAASLVGDQGRARAPRGGCVVVACSAPASAEIDVVGEEPPSGINRYINMESNGRDAVGGDEVRAARSVSDVVHDQGVRTSGHGAD